ncbi:MAG: hypothetical protein AB7Q81_17925 [Gammaproteobacteria bacterium]
MNGIAGRLVTKSLLVAALVVALPARAATPEFPPPDHAAVTVVSNAMTIQGRTMAVRSFVSDDTVEDIVAFYQELWKEPPVQGAPGVAYEPDALAPWHLLTRVEDGYVMTVQVQPSNSQGSFGYLALGKLPDPGDGPVPAPPDPPALAGSALQSTVVNDDPGKEAQTSMLINEFSVDSNVHFYRNHYQGWRKDIDQTMGNKSLHALSFRRGREQVIITIQGGRDGSQIVLNSIKHDVL